MRSSRRHGADCVQGTSFCSARPTFRAGHAKSVGDAASVRSLPQHGLALAASPKRRAASPLRGLGGLAPLTRLE